MIFHRKLLNTKQLQQTTYLNEASVYSAIWSTSLARTTFDLRDVNIVSCTNLKFRPWAHCAVGLVHTLQAENIVPVEDSIIQLYWFNSFDLSLVFISNIHERKTHVITPSFSNISRTPSYYTHDGLFKVKPSDSLFLDQNKRRLERRTNSVTS